MECDRVVFHCCMAVASRCWVGWPASPWETMMEFDPCAACGVLFGDPRLARCVRESGVRHAQEVRRLDCYQAGIRYLDGIEELTHVEVIDLHFNEVQNGKPLSRLRHLKELHMGLNLCPDLSYLANLGALEHLTLFDNDIEDVTPLKTCGVCTPCTSASTRSKTSPPSPTSSR